MKAPVDAAEIRTKARAWYERQMESIAQAHGASWPEHQEWIEDYLREQLRERLHALGWRQTA